ncbi:HD-GYP domain-containing protein [Cellulosilyticum ruminicola]|uniref:HD-GYP domain-containing protein n=1 Tax=Cellulosilyticum ruminicola TaxID=425254 RepID=UPI0006D177F9|nr:HD domain-containing protein [Cellulosilyticum ruminicola]
MQKIILPISKCIPGMITAQPIVDLKTGSTIIGQNQMLTEEFLNTLPNFIYNDIWVYLDSFTKVWNLPDEMIEKYKKYSEALTAVLGHFQDVAENHVDLNLDDFNKYCSQLSMDFKENYNLLGCTNLITQLDYSTYTHSLNVAFLAVLICRWCKLGKDLENLALQTGLLHDIGKLNLLNPSTSDILSPNELIEYEKHPIYGFNITSKIKDLNPEISKAILAHHETCNGTGFPLRLSAPYISKLTKIISLADAYDTLHNQYHIFETLRILLEDELTCFDPELLFTFCNIIANYYIGVFVKLNTGEIGEVVFINPKCVYKPMIRLNGRYINLFTEKQYSIIDLQ